MEVKDVGFVQTAAVVRIIEINAGLDDINYQRVHAYKVSQSGLRAKKAILAQIRNNQDKLTEWGKKGGKDENTLVLARSMYKANEEMIRICEAHIETIGFYLQASRLDV